MTFSEAMDALGALAGNNYHSLVVDVTKTDSKAPLTIKWKCYVNATGWGTESDTPQAALESMRLKLTKPAPTPADLDAFKAPGAEPDRRSGRRLELEDK